MNVKKLQSLILTVLFLGTIFILFVLHVITPDKEQSVLENRTLAKRPDFTFERYISGEYSERFDTYYSDQFPLRDRIVEVNAGINHNVFNQDVFNDVFLAEDGYLLSRVIKQDEKAAEEVATRINNFANEMAELDINIYTAIVPNKSTMMEEKFPSYFPSYGHENLDMLLEKLASNTNKIDTRDKLEKHKNEDYMFYYTDHHWQSKAAFYAYQVIMNKIIKNENMDEKIYEYDDYKWELEGKPFYGSDARKTTINIVEKSDQILVANLKGDHLPFEMRWGTKKREGLYDRTFLEMDEPYTNRYQAYMGGDYSLLTVHNFNKKEGLNTLVIKDSYANAFIQFLAPHYKEIHVMDLRHYKGKPIRDYVKDNDIDHIIILNNVNSIYVTPSSTNFDNPGQGDNQ